MEISSLFQNEKTEKIAVSTAGPQRCLELKNTKALPYLRNLENGQQTEPDNNISSEELIRDSIERVTVKYSREIQHMNSWKILRVCLLSPNMCSPSRCPVIKERLKQHHQEIHEKVIIKSVILTKTMDCSGSSQPKLRQSREIYSNKYSNKQENNMSTYNLNADATLNNKYKEKNKNSNNEENLPTKDTCNKNEINLINGTKPEKYTDGFIVLKNKNLTINDEHINHSNCGKRTIDNDFTVCKDNELTKVEKHRNGLDNTNVTNNRSPRLINSCASHCGFDLLKKKVKRNSSAFCYVSVADNYTTTSNESYGNELIYLKHPEIHRKRHQNQIDHEKRSAKRNPMIVHENINSDRKSELTLESGNCLMKKCKQVLNTNVKSDMNDDIHLKPYKIKQSTSKNIRDQSYNTFTRRKHSNSNNVCDVQVNNYNNDTKKDHKYMKTCEELKHVNVYTTTYKDSYSDNFPVKDYPMVYINKNYIAVSCKKCLLKYELHNNENNQSNETQTYNLTYNSKYDSYVDKPTSTNSFSCIGDIEQIEMALISKRINFNQTDNVSNIVKSKKLRKDDNHNSVRLVCNECTDNIKNDEDHLNTSKCNNDCLCATSIENCTLDCKDHHDEAYNTEKCKCSISTDSISQSSMNFQEINVMEVKHSIIPEENSIINEEDIITHEESSIKREENNIVHEGNSVQNSLELKNAVIHEEIGIVHEGNSIQNAIELKNSITHEKTGIVHEGTSIQNSMELKNSIKNVIEVKNSVIQKENSIIDKKVNCETCTRINEEILECEDDEISEDVDEVDCATQTDDTAINEVIVKYDSKSKIPVHADNSNSNLSDVIFNKFKSLLPFAKNEKHVCGETAVKTADNFTDYNITEIENVCKCFYNCPYKKLILVERSTSCTDSIKFGDSPLIVKHSVVCQTSIDSRKRLASTINSPLKLYKINSEKNSLKSNDINDTEPNPDNINYEEEDVKSSINSQNQIICNVDSIAGSKKSDSGKKSLKSNDIITTETNPDNLSLGKEGVESSINSQKQIVCNVDSTAEPKKPDNEKNSLQSNTETNPDNINFEKGDVESSINSQKQIVCNVDSSIEPNKLDDDNSIKSNDNNNTTETNPDNKKLEKKDIESSINSQKQIVGNVDSATEPNKPDSENSSQSNDINPTETSTDKISSGKRDVGTNYSTIAVHTSLMSRLNIGTQELSKDVETRIVISDWLRTITKNKNMSENQIAQLTDFVVLRISPLLDIPVSSYNHKIVLQTAIVNIISDLSIANKQLHNYAKVLSYKLLKVQAKYPDTLKYSNVAIKSDSNLKDGVIEREEALTNEIKKIFDEASIDIKENNNMLVEEVGVIIMDCYKIPHPEAERAKKEIENILAHDTNMSSTAAAELAEEIMMKTQKIVCKNELKKGPRSKICTVLVCTSVKRTLSYSKMFSHKTSRNY